MWLDLSRSSTRNSKGRDLTPSVHFSLSQWPEQYATLYVLLDLTYINRYEIQALGCVAAVPGYLKAMREVCDRYGALLVFDEIMCGMGRTGAIHAWQVDGVVPDIQLVGKGLAAGYGTISALLVSDRVVSGLKQGGGYFVHGQTYQSHPLGCAAAVEVQRIVKEYNLVDNCRKMGEYLGMELKLHLGDHPHVGDIRGRGLFWAVEFMEDKNSKTPFDSNLTLSKRLQTKGLEKGYDICLFAATGAVDGWNGDHFLLAPPYTVGKQDVDEIVSRVVKVIDSVFEDIYALRQQHPHHSGF